jgi:plastocyanin
MRMKWIVLPVLAAAAATALGVSLASARTSAQNATVKAFMSERFAVNRYFQEGMRFSPGTVAVASGGTLTFEYGDKEMDPHTLTIVSKADLPKTVAQVENCRSCQRYATPHLKHPKAEPGPSNPIVHWVLNEGQPGLDTVGDSLAIQPGAHKQISVKVTAPAGTTLYFICAVHPWMQGKIVVR